MSFVTLLVLLGCFAWLTVWVDRRIKAQQEVNEARAAMQSPPEPIWKQYWPLFWPQAQPMNAAGAFRPWAATTFATQPDIQHWLAALSDNAIQLLTAKLTDFCTDMGFEFSWLLQHTVDHDVTVAPHLESIAVHYIEACYQAYVIQDDIKVFQAWQDFTQNPYGKEQQVLAQRLLIQAFDQGLVSINAESLQTAPAQERAVYTVQAIREAAEKQPNAFRAILKTVLKTPPDVAIANGAIANDLQQPLPHSSNGKVSTVTTQPTPVAM